MPAKHTTKRQLSPRISPAIWLDRFAAVHGKGKFDYSKSIIGRAHGKIVITCLTCNTDFEQTPAMHASGQGCIKCAGKQQKTTDEFVSEAILKRGEDKFDYSEVEYVNRHTKVKITCKKCNRPFFQTPSNHLFNEQGCPHCAPEAISNAKAGDQEKFLRDAKIAHPDTDYDYSRAIYVRSGTKVEIGCPKCKQWFWQAPLHHTKGHGCPCNRANRANSMRHDKQKFIDLSVVLFGPDKYNYDRVVYINALTKVEIQCLKCKEWFWQKPGEHLHGYGCNLCGITSKGEALIELALKTLNIVHTRQKTFAGCKHKNNLKFDFYLPKYNLCIEYQGSQHFNVSEYFGGKKAYDGVVVRDQIKREWCAANGVRLIEIPYTCQDITTFLCEQLGLLQMPLFLR